MVTEDDINCIVYFWEEKRDLDRWVDWEAKREYFVKELPELVKAWDDYRTAGRIMDAIVRDIQQVRAAV